MSSKYFGYILIAFAGFFWSTLGLFTNTLTAAGFSSPQIAFTRLILGCLFITIYCFIRDPKSLKITKKGLFTCILLGLFCQALFNISYVNSIKYVGVSVGAVLLYTSPIFIAILSRIFMKEKITGVKLISLLVCFIGVLFAATGAKFDVEALNLTGILLGLVAAISYACMPLISKSALDENKNLTVILYAFLFGALFLLPIAQPADLITKINGFDVIINMIGLGLFPACFAFLFFYTGISKNIEFSIVGIVSSTELIGSQIIGWFVFKEAFSVMKLLGIVLMIGSAFIVLYGTRKQNS